ncbi:MAG: hypothetical protein IPM23_21960 [Candidatus Melainabacteria bacterium]|nr:hypothetical protein [Candidatus Melainabacteria bacterium]
MTTEAKSSWKTATYEDWNKWLIDRYLSNERNGSIVYRIPASPDELAALAACNESEVKLVTCAFIGAVKQVLPRGKSLCGFCLETNGWTPESTSLPHFFGILWFTCLLASGYPSGQGNIRERFRSIMGKIDNFTHGDDPYCLSWLWELIARWSAQHPDYSELVLPPEDDFLSIIGRSYFLAFPNLRDRKALKNVLIAHNLLEIEPPILRVMSALRENSDKFSIEFHRALAHFDEHFLKGGKDPVDSAFWRVIRAESLHGLSDSEVSGKKLSNPFTLLAGWDDDDMLALTIATTGEIPIEETDSLPLQFSVNQYTGYLNPATCTNEDLVARVLNRELHLTNGLSSIISQGVLIFQEHVSGDFLLARGEEVDGSSLALVRDDLIDGFIETYGGTAAESLYEGWSEVDKCTVQQLAELPPSLSEVSQLEHTTHAPRPRIVGGIRVDGAYLWLPPITPMVRAKGASKVSVTQDGKVWTLERDEGDDWALPNDLPITPPAAITIEATFKVHFEGAEFTRRATAVCKFGEGSYGIDYKPPGAGSYWLENLQTRTGHPFWRRFCASVNRY